MCWFIIVSVPRGHEPLLLELGEEGAGVGVHPVSGPSLATCLPPCDVQLLITGRGCACDLYRSSEDPKPPDDGAEGSEADFEQALEGSDTAAIDEAASRLDRRARRRFRETVAGLAHRVGAIRLVAHPTRGDIGTEALPDLATLTLSVRDYLANDGAFPADTIVTVTSSNTTEVPTRN